MRRSELFLFMSVLSMFLLASFLQPEAIFAVNNPFDGADTDDLSAVAPLEQLQAHVTLNEVELQANGTEVEALVDEVPSDSVVTGLELKLSIPHEGRKLDIEAIESHISAPGGSWRKLVKDKSEMVVETARASRTPSGSYAVLSTTEQANNLNGASAQGAWRVKLLAKDDTLLGQDASVSLVIHYTARVHLPNVTSGNEPTGAAILRLPASIELAQTSSTQPTQHGTPDGWELMASEDFEGTFPTGDWRVLDASDNGVELYWDDDDHKPHNGNKSAWPANGGADGGDPQYYLYANNMYSWMVYGPLDLSDATDAKSEFYMWHEIEVGYDYAFFGYSTDGNNFTTVKWDGSSDWTEHSLSYSEAVGESPVWVAWGFYSNGAYVDYGPFVDDIKIYKEINDPVYTATPTATPYMPTNTPIPTATATAYVPTNTPTATATATATAYVPTNTPTATATATAYVPTNTPTATATATAYVPTNTPTRTATPYVPTNTPTRTATPYVPTNTPIPTATSYQPTNTPIPTATSYQPTNTPIPTATSYQPTNTPIPTATSYQPTNTPIPTATPTIDPYPKLTIDVWSGQESINMSWDVQRPLSGDLHQYQLKRKANNGNFTIIATQTNSQYIDDDPELTSNVEYCYKVEALDSNNQVIGESDEGCGEVGKLTISVPDQIIPPNATNVPVTINLANGNGLCARALDIKLSYDESIVRANGTVAATIFTQGYAFEANSNTPGEVKISAILGQGCQELYGGGSLFNVFFDVIGAQSSVTSLDFIEGLTATVIYDEDDLSSPVPLILQSGSLTVGVNFVRGDVNGDGSVNAADAALALDIANELIEPTAQQEAACNVNGDPVCNSADSSLILCFAAFQDWVQCGGPESRNRLSRGVVVPDAPVQVAVGTIPDTQPGQTVLIPIQISDAPEFTGGEFSLTYDTNRMVGTGATLSSLTNAFELRTNSEQPGILHVSLANNQPIQADGVIFLAEFRITTDVSSIDFASIRLHDATGRDLETSALQRDVEATPYTAPPLETNHKLYLPLTIR